MKYKIVVHLFLRPVGGSSTFRDMATFIIDSVCSDSISNQIDDGIQAQVESFRARMRGQIYELISTDTLFCHPIEL